MIKQTVIRNEDYSIKELIETNDDLVVYKETYHKSGLISKTRFIYNEKKELAHVDNSSVLLVYKLGRSKPEKIY